jgi:hypothetical protein
MQDDRTQIGDGDDHGVSLLLQRGLFVLTGLARTGDIGQLPGQEGRREADDAEQLDGADEVIKEGVAHGGNSPRCRAGLGRLLLR